MADESWKGRYSTRPVVRVLGPGIGLTLVQICLLYILSAANFFEGNPFYNLYSYPFGIVYTVTVSLSNLFISQQGALQLLHAERVYMRLFFVIFTTCLVYFLLTRYRAISPSWAGLESLFEAVGLAATLAALQIFLLYILHTAQVFQAFQGAYKSLFFAFDYVYGALKFLIRGLLGQNERVLVLYTDIFKRIFFVILSVNLLWFAVSELVRDKNGDSG
ncbi:MAG: hypothetical protein GXO65_01215 [Euryarchaeota archaeon]|nr:hypothetical protein [Euryarchaeota archaeon]